MLLGLSNLKDMKYTFKETSEKIVSPHKNKFINTVSPWYNGNYPAEKNIIVYYVLLYHDSIIPEGEVLCMEFDQRDVTLEDPYMDEGLN